MPDYIMTFGEYKGEDISMVPRDRLNWYQEQLEDGNFPWMGEDTKKELEEEIELEIHQRVRSHSKF